MGPPKETGSETDSEGWVPGRAEGRGLCSKGMTGTVEDLKESLDTEHAGVLCPGLTNLLRV